MNAIHTLADGLHLGTAQSAGTLTMVPLLRNKAATLAYLAFGSALKQGLVEVTELGPGGSVPEVQVVNRAGLPVLFLDGEALVGAKQNRVLNLSVLVPAKATTVIPVSCVEAGRWSPRSRAFVDGESLHFAQGRARKVASVSAAMAAGAGRRSDQRQVWDNMDSYRCDLEADAPSGAMQDVYTKVRGTVQDLVDELRCEDGQVGAAFLLRGELVGLDVLGDPGTFGELHEKIARSYAIEALRASTADQVNAQHVPADLAATAALVSRALAQLATASWQPHPAIGLGTDLRLSSPEWDAAALAVDDELVHVAAFPRRRAART